MRSLTTIQNAIATWIEAATGLPTLWANQDAPRPETAYALLNSTVTPVSRPWVDVSANPTPSAGEEGLYTSRTVERLNLTIQIFNTSTILDGSAGDLLSSAILASQLPTRAAALSAAGWSPAAFGEVTDISAPRGAAYFESRTRLTCFGYTAPEASEAGCIIEAAEFTNSEGVVRYAGDAERQRIQANMEAAADVAVAIESTGVPPLLGDWDHRTPATAWVAGRTGFSSAFADDEWLMQSHTAGSFANNVGTATLDNTNGFNDQEAIGLYDGTDAISRKAWEGITTGSQLLCSDTAVGDAAGQDLCVRVVFRINQFTTGDVVVSKRTNGGDFAGWGLSLSSGGVPVLSIDEGPTQVVFNVIGTVTDSAWHYVTFWFNATTGDCKMKSDLGPEVTSATGYSSFSSSSGMSVNAQWPGHTSSACKQQLGYLGTASGVSAEAMYNEEFFIHATDPSGLLNVRDRDSLISLPVSASGRICHYSGGSTAAQLPIGFSPLLEAGAGGFGLYHNGSTVNLVPDSDTISAWTAANATVVDNDGNAPDGFRSASSVTATAAAGSVRTAAMPVSASTEYTFSVPIKRNFGSDVAGGLRLYDVSNGAFIGSTQAFTAGIDYGDPESRTFTTPVGCTSVYAYVEVDTNGESIFLWGAQLNLGDRRGAATIRTNGGSSALVWSDYQTTGLAGAWCRAGSGQIEQVHVPDLYLNSSCYLISANNGTDDNSHRYMRVDTVSDYVGGVIYDDAGSAASSLDGTGAAGLQAQENTSVLKWASTGALSVAAGAEGELLLDGADSQHTVGTFTATEEITDIEIGQYRNPGSTFSFNGFISRTRIWYGEQ